VTLRRHPTRRRLAGPWRHVADGLPRALGILAALGVLAPGVPAQAEGHDPDCPRFRAAFASMPTRTVVIEASGRPELRVPVRLGASEEARRAGFQCATVEEIERTVILFDFGAEVFRGFHMWNVPAPLDIAFVKASGRIFSILRMEPGARETYGPMGRFRYALEAREGFFKTHGIAVEHSIGIREGP
jgi:uncharacterized membrane protein (UPF0127 family)